MRTLSVTSFSCVDEAELELGNLTVLIGPQASGKSVLSKLVYFFNSLLDEQFKTLLEGQNLEKFRGRVKEQFHLLFPSSAWGNKKFSLRYSAGDYQVSITRAISRKSPGENNIRIGFSPFFNARYNDALKGYDSGIKKLKSAEDLLAQLDIEWDIEKKVRLAVQKRLGKNYTRRQLFIPAGRSFFTNAGKAFLILEQGKLLDPIITRFGRFFTAWREQLRNSFPHSDRSSFEEISTTLLGGRVKIEDGAELLVTEDGRKVPFTAMSSGQQELLPLVLALHEWSSIGQRVGSRLPPRQLIYIEEPEAHLFPTAQSHLVEFFARIINGSKGQTDLFLTTHSPYVLSKINNLVKAYVVASGHRAARDDVAAIIPQKSWIPAKSVRAYAIENRKLTPILDETGLIDAVYLDEVSSEISREFSALLGIEVGRG
jgi:predicted ATPase